MSGGLPPAVPTGRGYSYRRPEGRGRGRGRRAPQWSGPLRPEPPAEWFPTDVEEAFAASVRLPHGTSLLVDTGAPGNLSGSEWTKDHARELQSADLPPPRYQHFESI